MDTTTDAAHLAGLVHQAHADSLNDALTALAELRAGVRRLEDLATDRAVEAGWSYARIGRLLGMSRQSVRAKHLARLAHGDRSQAAAYWSRIAAARERWDQEHRDREAELLRYFEAQAERRRQAPT
jgi:hypothetical protein